MWPHITDDPAETDQLAHQSLLPCAGCNVLAQQLAVATVAAESAAESKSLFLANVSHEIRTPLNGMLVSAELLLRTALTPEQRELVATISESGTALLSVLGDVLDYSCLGRGDVDLHVQPVWLRDILEGSLEAFAPDAAARQVKLSYRISPELAQEQVLADEIRVRQILSAFVSNAVKFNVSGGDAEITASVLIEEVPAEEGQQQNVESDDDVVLPVNNSSSSTLGEETLPVHQQSSLRISVRDTGVGMDPAMLQKSIFGGFSRVDTSLNRTHEGLGLGLAIAGRLATLMGGKIDVKSAPGCGSTFTLTLPLTWVSDLAANNGGGGAATACREDETIATALSAVAVDGVKSAAFVDAKNSAFVAPEFCQDQQPSTPSACSMQEPRVVNAPTATESSYGGSDVSSFPSDTSAIITSYKIACSAPGLSAAAAAATDGTFTTATNTTSNSTGGGSASIVFEEEDTQTLSASSTTLAASSAFYQPSSPSMLNSSNVDSFVNDDDDNTTTTTTTTKMTGNTNQNPHQNKYYYNPKILSSSPSIGGAPSSVCPSRPSPPCRLGSAATTTASASEIFFNGRSVLIDMEHMPTEAQIADSCTAIGMDVVFSSATAEGDGDAATADVCITTAANALNALRRSGRRHRIVVAIGRRADVPLVAHPAVVMVPHPVRHARLVNALREALRPRLPALHAPLHPDPTCLQSLLESALSGHSNSAKLRGALAPVASDTTLFGAAARGFGSAGAVVGTSTAAGNGSGSASNLASIATGAVPTRCTTSRRSVDNSLLERRRRSLAEQPWQPQLPPMPASRPTSPLDDCCDIAVAAAAAGGGGASFENYTSSGSTTKYTKKDLTAYPVLNILIAEDNSVNQRVVLRVLQSAAPTARVDIASNGIEVLAACDKLDYDVIFMDIHMPLMDGLEATMKLRERLPAEKFPLVVALSADTIGDLPARCLAAGMAGFMPKPFKVEQVERVVQMVHEARRSTQ